MQIRNPAVAGRFYPADSEGLRKTIDRFLEKADVKKNNCIGLVAPHAGYYYCGKTAACAYKSVSGEFDTIVILGPNHTGLGSGVATSIESWKTPLGTMSADEEFAKEIIKNSLITIDPKSHLMEHSIEVQLPWIQCILKDVRIVPICINPIYFDEESCSEIGEKIAEVAKHLKRKILIIASSDFSHHGAAYEYEPFRGKASEVLKSIKSMDREVIDFITKLNPDKVLHICEEKRLTICGYGGIAAMLYAAKLMGAKKGELIDYSTSYDVSSDISAVVGYAGISIY